MIETVHPASGETLTKFDEIAAGDLESVVCQAETCVRTWRNSGFAQRSEIVAAAASLMESQVDELARLATLERGELHTQAQVRYC